MIPVAGLWVTLHRVGSDTAAPMDSVRSDAEGNYEFRFRRTGDERAVYFVSASYGGVAYFTPPLVHSIVRGAEAEIAVFDTTSARVPISIRGRHVVVSAVDANSRRSVTEVYEIANDSTVTRVAGSGRDGAVWSALVPSKATGFAVTQGDIPSSGLRFENGKAQVYAPVAPGLRQLSFTYSLPPDAFPLSLPLTEPVQIFEVLIEEEQGTASGAKLKEAAPVALERRTFRRFLADDVPANAVTVIDLPAAAVKGQIDPKFIVALTGVIAAAMLFALARALSRR